MLISIGNETLDQNNPYTWGLHIYSISRTIFLAPVDMFLLENLFVAF